MFMVDMSMLASRRDSGPRKSAGMYSCYGTCQIGVRSVNAILQSARQSRCMPAYTLVLPIDRLMLCSQEPARVRLGPRLRVRRRVHVDTVRLTGTNDEAKAPRSSHPQAPLLIRTRSPQRNSRPCPKRAALAVPKAPACGHAFQLHVIPRT